MKRILGLILAVVMAACGLAGLAESAEVRTSGLSISDLEAALREETSFEKCAFVETEAEEGKLYRFPDGEAGQSFLVATDENGMVRQITYTYHNYMGVSNPVQEVTYFESLDYSSYARDVSNMTNIPMRRFGVISYVNDAANIVMYLTGNHEDNPYSRVFDARHAPEVENGWEFAVTTDKDVGWIALDFKFVGSDSPARASGAIYEEIGPFSEGLAAAKQGGKWGYIDPNGQVVIPFAYDEASEFNDGIAKVSLDSKKGYIDATGKVVIPIEFDGAFEHREDGKTVFVKVDNQLTRWGAYTPEGRAVFPFGTYNDVTYGGEGTLNVAKRNAFGFVDRGIIDAYGNVVLPIGGEYSTWGKFSDGLICVTKNREYGYANHEGEIVIPPQYDDARDFSEGLAQVQRNDKWGYIDVTGKEIIPLEYEDSKSFSEGLAAVQKDGKWGYIDASGAVVIPLAYDDAMPFFGGAAAIQKDGKWGSIDPEGNAVIPCAYDEACSEDGGYMFRAGDSEIHSLHEGLAAVKEGDRWGYIDEAGEAAIPCEYDSAAAFVDGFARVGKDEKYGYIDTTGKVVIPCEYEKNNVAYSEGYFLLLKDGEITILSRDEL